MTIEPISTNNLEALARLMSALWPDCDLKEELDNCYEILNSDKETCYLVKDEEAYVAFIQLSLRYEYVEGVLSYPVAYIEGIYVEPTYQKTGIGTTLVKLGANWGKQLGCKYYASDTELNNQGSIIFHKKAGFKEVNRLVCFVREI